MNNKKFSLFEFFKQLLHEKSQLFFYFSLVLVCSGLLGLRLVNFSNNFLWHADISRDFLIAKHITVFHEMKIISPLAAGGAGVVKNSILYFYFFSFLYAIFPKVLNLELFFTLSSFLIMFITSWKIFLFIQSRLQRSLLVTLVMLIPFIREINISLFQPSLVIPFFFLFLYFMYQGLSKRIERPLFIAAILFIFMVDIHFSALVLLPVSVMSFLFVRSYTLQKKKNKRGTFWSKCWYFISAPPILILFCNFVLLLICQVIQIDESLTTQRFERAFQSILSPSLSIFTDNAAYTSALWNNFLRTIIFTRTSNVEFPYYLLFVQLFYLISISVIIFGVIKIQKVQIEEAPWKRFLFFCYGIIGSLLFMIFFLNIGYFLEFPYYYYFLFIVALIFILLFSLILLPKIIRNLCIAVYLIILLIINGADYQYIRLNYGEYNFFQEVGRKISSDIISTRNYNFTILAFDQWKSVIFWSSLEEATGMRLVKLINTNNNIEPLEQSASTFYIICLIEENDQWMNQIIYKQCHDLIDTFPYQKQLGYFQRHQIEIYKVSQLPF